MKFKSIIATLALLPSILMAQWTSVSNSGISGNFAELVPIRANAGKLYALTSSGVFVSASGNGGDWAAFGTGLSGSNVKDLYFAHGVTLAHTGTDLYKLVGSNWTKITYDVPNTPTDLGSGTLNLQTIYEIPYNSGYRIFVGQWGSNAANDPGMFISDDQGATWKCYNKYTTNLNNTGTTHTDSVGLYLPPSNTAIIAKNFHYHASSGKLFCNGKNMVQISDDKGNTWYPRIGNYLLNQATSNTRSLFTRDFDGQGFLFIGTDYTSADFYTLASTKINQNVALEWTNHSYMSSSVRSMICDYTEDYLFTLFRTNGVSVSYDNGVTREALNTGLTANDVYSIAVIGNYLYATVTTNKIYKYDLTTLPAISKVKITVTDGVSNLAGAVVSFNGNYFITDDAGVASIYGLKNNTYSYTVTKDGYTESTGNIAVNSSDVNKSVTLTTLVSARSSAADVNVIFRKNDILFNSDVEQCAIYDVTGKQVFVGKNVHVLNTANLDGGIYILKYTRQGISKTLKFIKR